MRKLVVIVLLFAATTLLGQEVNVPDAEQLVGAPAGQALQDPELTVRTQSVASGIRCPVCQGLSIADSPSEMAVNMKHQVRSLLARGYTRPQIERYFELSYGQFILLQPRFHGVNALVWIFPLLALATGAVIVVVTMRRLGPDKLEKGASS